jgi:hypothetical protein
MGNTAVGFIAVAISSLFWGSNFVPVKEFPTGDGVYFQWVYPISFQYLIPQVMCCGIYFVGLIVNGIRAFPKYEAFSMIGTDFFFFCLCFKGGFLWCTGNILTVPIVRLIGLGIGLLLWSMVSLLVGWASGRFGLFGLKVTATYSKVLTI